MKLTSLGVQLNSLRCAVNLSGVYSLSLWGVQLTSVSVGVQLTSLGCAVNLLAVIPLD